MVGVVFLQAALGMLGDSLVAFPANLRRWASPSLSLPWLVMIIMEVLRRVLSYLQERATSLQPFLYRSDLGDPAHPGDRRSKGV
jgi:hypothetical protein